MSEREMPKKKMLDKTLDILSNGNGTLLNVANRPRRSINYEKFDYDKIPAELLKKLEDNDEDESDDEDFNPMEDAENEEEDEDDEQNASNSHDEGDEENSDVDDGNESSASSQLDHTESSSLCQNVDETMSTGESVFKKENDKKKLTNGHATTDLAVKKPKMKRLVKATAKPKINKNKKKFKKNSASRTSKCELDDDTQKFINSFRTAKIVSKSNSRQAKVASDILVKGSSLNGTIALKSKINTGPFVKKVEHQLTLDSESTKPIAPATCQSVSSFVVCNHDDLPNTDKLTTGKYAAASDMNASKLGPSKDKIDPITDFESAWVCALCSNSPHSMAGLGDLYGPYRVSLISGDIDDSNDSNGKAY